MNNKITSLKTTKHESGFLLIEVLVAFVVIAFGMLGIAGMITITLKSNSSSYIKQQAVQSAYDIADRIRANSVQAIAGSYNVNNVTTGAASAVSPATPAIDCGSTICTDAQLATYDTWYWLAKDVAQLPNGSGSVVTVPSGSNTLVTITVQWDDAPAQKTLGATSTPSGASANLAQFTIQTIL
ncbi:type IV pilus assembly protein PilV [Undibacterium sp. GrIS 1.8]|uniref:type IV pilus modification protein PilV n=1 Tax=unclassified Undibacterium TaxID=2630295 RepID=UPI00339800E0